MELGGDGNELSRGGWSWVRLGGGGWNWVEVGGWFSITPKKKYFHVLRQKLTQILP